MTVHHVSHIEPTEPETVYCDGGYRIVCALCGPVAEYAGRQFTSVEARRHDDYFNGRR